MSACSVSFHFGRLASTVALAKETTLKYVRDKRRRAVLVTLFGLAIASTLVGHWNVDLSFANSFQSSLTDADADVAASDGIANDSMSLTSVMLQPVSIHIFVAQLVVMRFLNGFISSCLYHISIYIYLFNKRRKARHDSGAAISNLVGFGCGSVLQNVLSASSYPQLSPVALAVVLTLALIMALAFDPVPRTLDRSIAASSSSSSIGSNELAMSSVDAMDDYSSDGVSQSASRSATTRTLPVSVGASIRKLTTYLRTPARNRPRWQGREGYDAGEDTEGFMEGYDTGEDHMDYMVPSRYIRGCANDSQEALRRWRATLKWRRQNNIDGILRRPQSDFNAIKEFYPHFFHGETKTGQPVCYELVGKINAAKLTEHGVTSERLLNYYIFSMEYLWTHICSDQDNGQVVTILDIKGVGLSDLMGDALEFLKMTAKVVQEHYVERCRKMFIVNAPFYFNVLWRMVLPLLNANTAKKIVVLGSDKSELFELVDHRHIPIEYGGSGPPLGSSREEQTYREYVEKLNAGNFDFEDASVARALFYGSPGRARRARKLGRGSDWSNSLDQSTAIRGSPGSNRKTASQNQIPFAFSRKGKQRTGWIRDQSVPMISSSASLSSIGHPRGGGSRGNCINDVDSGASSAWSEDGDDDDDDPTVRVQPSLSLSATESGASEGGTTAAPTAAAAATAPQSGRGGGLWGRIRTLTGRAVTTVKNISTVVLQGNRSHSNEPEAFLGTENAYIYDEVSKSWILDPQKEVPPASAPVDEQEETLIRAIQAAHLSKHFDIESSDTARGTKSDAGDVIQNSRSEMEAARGAVAGVGGRGGESPPMGLVPSSTTSSDSEDSDVPSSFHTGQRLAYFRMLCQKESLFGFYLLWHCLSSCMFQSACIVMILSSSYGGMALSIDTVALYVLAASVCSIVFLSFIRKLLAAVLKKLNQFGCYCQWVLQTHRTTAASTYPGAPVPASRTLLSQQDEFISVLSNNWSTMAQQSSLCLGFTSLAMAELGGFDPEAAGMWRKIICVALLTSISCAYWDMNYKSLSSGLLLTSQIHLHNHQYHQQPQAVSVIQLDNNNLNPVVVLVMDGLGAFLGTIIFVLIVALNDRASLRHSGNRLAIVAINVPFIVCGILLALASILCLYIRIKHL
jgi:CRAL/TRIO domain